MTAGRCKLTDFFEFGGGGFGQAAQVRGYGRIFLHAGQRGFHAFTALSSIDGNLVTAGESVLCKYAPETPKFPPRNNPVFARKALL